jgi:predicted DNA-binding antitoxin AbrB/MazE fold protein
MKIISISSTTGDIGRGSNCFPDVHSNDWFAPYVCYAKEHGIVKGYDDGMFKPNQNVAIVEGLKMGVETFLIDVGNVKKDDAWYQQYLEFVHNNNIFSKYNIAPTKNMSRGEMAYFIHQLMIQKE